MELKNSCADCLNLGRAVYCMQCVRMNKGHKDMFRSNAPVSLPHIIRLLSKGELVPVLLKTMTYVIIFKKTTPSAMNCFTVEGIIIYKISRGKISPSSAVVVML